MALKLLVWATIIFLIGSVALVTYFTFLSPSAIEKNKNRISSLRYMKKAETRFNYSINQLDSLSAANNYWFTKENAESHPLYEL